jgi:hypothetical protein
MTDMLYFEFTFMRNLQMFMSPLAAKLGIETALNAIVKNCCSYIHRNVRCLRGYFDIYCYYR